ALQVGQRILHADADDQVLVQHRAVGVAPPDGVGAVLLLQIVLPKLFAGEVIGGQVAIAEVDDDSFAVGHRRWAGQVVQAMKPLVTSAFAWLAPYRRAGADLLSPGDAARRLVNPQQQELVVVLGSQEEGVTPDRRRACSLPGQRALPDDVGLLVP